MPCDIISFSPANLGVFLLRFILVRVVVAVVMVGGGVYSAWGLKTLLDLYGFIKNKTWKKLPLFLQMLSVFPSPKLHALESQ